MRDLTYSEARLLLVDDDPAMIMFLQGLLGRAGYSHLLSTVDPREVLSLCEATHPDLIILDLNMPHMDGFEVLGQLRGCIGPAEYVPVLVLTGNESSEARVRALFLGARDFLNKPFEPVELLLRMHNLLEARFLHLHLQEQNTGLRDRVSERSIQLLEAQNDTIERLAQVVEFHDDATGKHTRRVGESAAATAVALGLSGEAVEVIRRAAPLHDVGKIGVPDSILLKPGRLTPDEFEVVKMHTDIGARILSGGRSEYLRAAEEIAHSHHERWDGLGYPQGLAGESIPLAARIVAVADFFDALTHDRPYRRAWSPAETLEEIAEGAGSQFDPEIATAFLRAHG